MIYHLTTATILSAQKVVLTVTENKKQLINIICEELQNDKDFIDSFSHEHTLLITGEGDPVEIARGRIIPRPDISTSREEATKDISPVEARTKTDQLRVVEPKQRNTSANRHNDSHGGSQLSAPGISPYREFAGPGEHWASKATLGTPSTKNTHDAEHVAKSSATPPPPQGAPLPAEKGT